MNNINTLQTRFVHLSRNVSDLSFNKKAKRFLATGTLFVAVALALVPQAVRADPLLVDFNGDGVADSYRFGFDYLEINMDGTGLTTTYHPSTNFRSAYATWYAADFNGDGKTDLAGVVNGRVTHPNYVELWLSKGDGSFRITQCSPSQDYNTTLGYWEVTDVNSDGRADLLHHVNGQYRHPWVSKGNGTFTVRREERP